MCALTVVWKVQHSHAATTLRTENARSHSSTSLVHISQVRLVSWVLLRSFVKSVPGRKRNFYQACQSSSETITVVGSLLWRISSHSVPKHSNMRTEEIRETSSLKATNLSSISSPVISGDPTTTTCSTEQVTSL
jgi:hypothetical protein